MVNSHSRREMVTLPDEQRKDAQNSGHVSRKNVQSEDAVSSRYA